MWFKDLGTCDWQVPNGVAELHGVIVGGGGAGAGPNIDGNRGGDGGEVVDFTSNSLGSTLTINVGAGGTGTRTHGAAGGSGSASSIDNQGTLSTAQGGAGGIIWAMPLSSPRGSTVEHLNVSGVLYYQISISSCSAKYPACYAATRSHESGALGEDVARGHLVSGKS